MSETAPTHVFWNPGAGSAERWANVRDRLAADPNVVLHAPTGRDHALEEIARLLAEPVDRIVAAGGDGTVSTVVEGLMRSEHRPHLGILPVGTGNDLARSLGIPLDPNESLAVLESGSVRAQDVMQIHTNEGTRFVANMVTGGNSGRYLGRMTEEVKRQWGPLCYLRGVLDLAFDLETFHVEIALDDGPSESFEALNVFLANGRTSGGGLAVSPEAELDDGFADLIVIREGTWAGIAELTTQFVVSDYLNHELVEFRRAARITVHSDPPLPLTADGEVIGTTPLELHVARRALEVIAPDVPANV